MQTPSCYQRFLEIIVLATKCIGDKGDDKGNKGKHLGDGKGKGKEPSKDKDKGNGEGKDTGNECAETDMVAEEGLGTRSGHGGGGGSGAGAAEEKGSAGLEQTWRRAREAAAEG